MPTVNITAYIHPYLMHITWSKAHSSSPGWSVRAGSGSSLDGGRRPTKLRTAGGLPDALESIPMLCVTLLALFEERDGASEMNVTLLVASSFLSLLSLTFGVFCYTSDHNDKDMIRPYYKAVQFVATLVDVVWFLAVGFTSGITSPWLFGALGPLLLVLGLPGCLRGYIEVLHMILKETCTCYESRYIRWPLLAFYVFAIDVLVGFLMLVFDQPLCYGYPRRSRVAAAFASFGIKRPFLLCIAILSLMETGWPLWRTVLLACLGVADAFASVFLYHQLGYAKDDHVSEFLKECRRILKDCRRRRSAVQPGHNPTAGESDSIAVLPHMFSMKLSVLWNCTRLVPAYRFSGMKYKSIL